MNLDALFTLSYGMYVVSSRANGRMGGFICNALMQVTAEPPRLAVAMNRLHHTYELITASRRLSAAVISEDAPLAFIGRFGFRSGRTFEKYAGIAYGTMPSGCPYPEEHILACLDLAVERIIEVETHVLLLCSLEDAVLLGQGRPMTYAYYREVLRGKTPPTAPSYVKVDAAKEAVTTKLEKKAMTKYKCEVCGYIYDPDKGDPENNIPPGTAFEDLPEDWVCPVCGAGKEEFSPVAE